MNPIFNKNQISETMRTMTRLLLLSAFFILLLPRLNAQHRGQLKLGITGGVSLPGGDLRDECSQGFDGMATFRYFFTDRFALGIQSGFVTMPVNEMWIEYFSRNEYPEKEALSINYHFIPVMITADHFFAQEGVRPYIGAGLGMTFWSATTDYLGTKTRSALWSDFAICAHMGSLFKLSKKFDLGFSAEYQAVIKSRVDLGYITLNGGVIWNM
ncbi:MAG TPA: hypothetical protein DCR43_09285 [Bacteroidales bacterium]|nr:MAG: hypothetical protein A2X11_03300 [Bacteroidetes bacterium GWE2_42_24]OFY32750.1 MAG: hypothetical protein A2X09_06825 [Bacteroidetes bacterium GWF2_43_11]HAQ66026.1 hypothetical protein [Bacteroidales bacterium]HBZ65276.1 hypothetical protein [Bacteroidales bacterium]